MRLHANAALSLNKRRQLCRRVIEGPWSLAEAAAAAEVSERTASKWVGRYRREGEPGLLILTRIGIGKLGRVGLERARRYERERPGALIHIDVKKLGRIEGGAGHRITGRRRDSGRRTDRDGVRRLQLGWEFVHIAIDDCTRLAYAEVLPDERATTRSLSCAGHWPSTAATASRSSGC